MGHCLEHYGTELSLLHMESIRHQSKLAESNEETSFSLFTGEHRDHLRKQWINLPVVARKAFLIMSIGIIIGVVEFGVSGSSEGVGYNQGCCEERE